MIRYSIPELQAYLRDVQYRELLQSRPGTVLVLKDYDYTTGQQTLAHGGNVSPQINMQANADFVCFGASFRVNNSGAAYVSAATPVPNVSVLITDTGSNEQWMSQAVDLSQWAAGNVEQGYNREFNWPRVIGGRTSISVGLTSFEAAADWKIELQLHGMLVYITG